MKKLFFYSSLLIIPIILSSFKNKSSKFLPKELKGLKAVTQIPSGTFNGQKMSSYYMFSNEVSNLDYLEFIYYLKSRNRTEELTLAQVDTSLWNNINANGNRFYAKRYHKMHNYPVVNISKRAAELYCEWLSEIWNNQQDKFIVEFRLPTEQEWEYAALGGKEPKNRDYFLKNKQTLLIQQVQNQIERIYNNKLNKIDLKFTNLSKILIWDLEYKYILKNAAIRFNN